MSAWMNCDANAKAMQTRRLREAKATGATVLVTSCPKCEIHLKCALADKTLSDEFRVEIKDLAALAAEALP